MKNLGFVLFVTFFSYILLTLLLMLGLLLFNLGLPGSPNGISEFAFNICIIVMSITSVGVGIFAANKH